MRCMDGWSNVACHKSTTAETKLFTICWHKTFDRKTKNAKYPIPRYSYSYNDFSKKSFLWQAVEKLVEAFVFESRHANVSSFIKIAQRLWPVSWTQENKADRRAKAALRNICIKLNFFAPYKRLRTWMKSIAQLKYW